MEGALRAPDSSTLSRRFAASSPLLGDFDIHTVSLHEHERLDPRTIIEAVRRRNGDGQATQPSLFESDAENPSLREAIEFYAHPRNWSNRLVAGDSLIVMNSLIEKEALAGKVQMIYFDPPYGIKYGSNFQPFVNERAVKDGEDADLTAETEQIAAFRDTWELGVHSYLAYLRDRLLVARDLLTESGSVFVQIGDENVHLVRLLMDEVLALTILWELSLFGPTVRWVLNTCLTRMTMASGIAKAAARSSIANFKCLKNTEKTRLSISLKTLTAHDSGHVRLLGRCGAEWIPAYAGMTERYAPRPQYPLRREGG